MSLRIARTATCLEIKTAVQNVHAHVIGNAHVRNTDCALKGRVPIYNSLGQVKKYTCLASGF